jgi:hypothetical protein
MPGLHAPAGPDETIAQAALSVALQALNAVQHRDAAFERRHAELLERIDLVAERAAARVHDKLAASLEEAIRDALQTVGLHDEAAPGDLRDLRNFIGVRRDLRRRVLLWGAGLGLATVSFVLFPLIKAWIG